MNKNKTKKKNIKLSNKEKIKGFAVFKAIPLAFFVIAELTGSIELFLVLFVSFLLICSYLKNLYNKNPNKFPKYFEILNEENIGVNKSRTTRTNSSNYFNSHHCNSHIKSGSLNNRSRHHQNNYYRHYSSSSPTSTGYNLHRR